MNNYINITPTDVKVGIVQWAGKAMSILMSDRGEDLGEGFPYLSRKVLKCRLNSVTLSWVLEANSIQWEQCL